MSDNPLIHGNWSLRHLAFQWSGMTAQNAGYFASQAVASYSRRECSVLLGKMGTTNFVNRIVTLSRPESVGGCNIFPTPRGNVFVQMTNSNYMEFSVNGSTGKTISHDGDHYSTFLLERPDGKFLLSEPLKGYVHELDVKGEPVGCHNINEAVGKECKPMHSAMTPIGVAYSASTNTDAYLVLLDEQKGVTASHTLPMNSISGIHCIGGTFFVIHRDQCAIAKYELRNGQIQLTGLFYLPAFPNGITGNENEFFVSTPTALYSFGKQLECKGAYSLPQFIALTSCWNQIAYGRENGQGYLFMTVFGSPDIYCLEIDEGKKGRCQ